MIWRAAGPVVSYWQLIQKYCRYIWVKNKSWFYTPVMKQPQPIQVSERDSVSIKSQISGSNNDGTCVHYGHLLYLLFPHHPRPLSWKGQYSIKDSCLYTQINFPVQGLVLNGQPNLNLFNQLYWVITYFFSSFLKYLLSRWSHLVFFFFGIFLLEVITSAFVTVWHGIFPLPLLISGTFPAESRYPTFSGS